MLPIALHLLRHPRTGWTAIAAHPHTLSALAARLILPGSFVSALAVTAGITWFNHEWNADFGYSAPASRALPIGLAMLTLSVIYTLVLAAVFTGIGRMYRSRASYMAALTLAAYGSLPVSIAGAFMFLMPAVLLAMLAFVYTCLLYNHGAHVLLHVAEAESSEFVAISLLLAAIAMTLFSMVASALRIL